MKNKLLSPLADDVFKGIFGDQRDTSSLAAFLKPVTQLPDGEYCRLTIVDPFLRRLFKRDKQGVLDIKALTTSGKIINVEVQICRFAAIRQRVLYYLAKLITEQMRRGDGYDRIQQVILILICDHVIIEDDIIDTIIPGPSGLPSGGLLPEYKPQITQIKTRYMNSFSLRNDADGKSFTNLIKIITIELPKVPRETDREAVWPWARFFTCREEEEYEMLAKEYPEVEKAVVELKKMSWGERRREIAFREKLWKMDREVLAREARREGVAEVARKALMKGMSLDVVSEITGLDLETVKNLAGE
jgi:hypothetical protein